MRAQRPPRSTNTFLSSSKEGTVKEEGSSALLGQLGRGEKKFSVDWLGGGWHDADDGVAFALYEESFADHGRVCLKSPSPSGVGEDCDWGFGLIFLLCKEAAFERFALPAIEKEDWCYGKIL